MKAISSLLLAGLVAASLTTPIAAAPPSRPGVSDQFWTRERIAEWNSGYPACMRLCMEIGWNGNECTVGCNARWNHQFNVNRLIPAREHFGTDQADSKPHR